MKAITNKYTLSNDWLALASAICFIFIELWSRGVVIYTTLALILAYAALNLPALFKKRVGNLEARQSQTENQNDHKTNIKRGTSLIVDLSLIASLTTTLVGHTQSLETFKYLLLALTLVIIVNYKSFFTLLKSSKAIAFYMCYCLWITLSLWVSGNQSPKQIEFYLLILTIAIALALLISKNDLYKKTMGFTLALAVIATSCQRGVTPELNIAEPEGLVITYKNLAAFVGILSITTLISLKPKNSFSIINCIVMAVAAIAILITPSQAGKISLIALSAYLLWIYTYRILAEHKLMQKVVLITGIIAIAAVSVASTIYHKEISSALGRKATLGGRTTIWEVTIDWVRLYPITGNGGAFWINQGGSAASNHHHEYVNRGYNGFIDTVVQSGIPSLLLLVLVLTTLVYETKLRWGERIMLLMFATLSLMTESHSFAGTFLANGATTARAILLFWVAYCLSQNAQLLKVRNQKQ